MACYQGNQPGSRGRDKLFSVARFCIENRNLRAVSPRPKLACEQRAIGHHLHRPQRVILKVAKHETTTGRQARYLTLQLPLKLREIFAAMLEICVDSLISLHNAIKGGADRIELCSNLKEGGTTPSYGMTKIVREICLKHNIKLFVMLRPKGGADFTLSEQEVEIIIADINALKLLVDGFVFGVLDNNGDVDIEICKTIISECRPLEVTFHRAIDTCRNYETEIENIISLGFGRILTSGGRATALEGAEYINLIKEKSKERILIVAGAGINGKNIQDVYQLSNADEYHGSAKIMDLVTGLYVTNADVVCKMADFLKSVK